MIALAPLAASAVFNAGTALASSVSSSLTKTLDSKGLDGAAAADAGGATGKTKESKAKKTADDFEKMFLEQTMDRLNGAESTEGPLGENGTGGGIYRSMMNKEYAASIVKSGGVGISDQVYKQMMAMQDVGGGHAAR